jgi:ABC-type multidrug transport system ATPase subunit
MKSAESAAQPKSHPPGLSIRQLCAWFEQDSGEHGDAVFWGVSFDVPPGCIMGVAGPNGSGKTTLIRCIAGLHEWRTGEIKVDDHSVSTQRIGFVPQAYAESFYPWASLLTNIRMIAGASRPHVAEIVQEFDIGVDLGVRPPQCSGGMIQQAAILRALTTNPKLLIADEPFSALDVRVAATVRRVLRAYVQHHGISAIVVSHDLISLVELCDSVLVVPGIPYSTTRIEGYEVAEVIQNENLLSSEKPVASNADDAGSFVDRMKKLLLRIQK